MKRKCVIIAGEMSADVLGSEIISSNQNIDWYGIGGPYMKQKNLKSILNWERITGFGFFEVILKLPILLYNAHILANKIIQIEPKLIITVDTKGFNFYLIQIIRKKIKNKSYMPRFIHLVAPTVWAWRPNRAKKISKIVDTLLCLFPKEPYFFRNFDLDCLFVGHPAVQNFSKLNNRPVIYNKLGIEDKKELIISLLPGSRKNEVKKTLPILISVSKILESKIEKPILFLCQAAPNQENLIRRILIKYKSDIIIVKKDDLGEEITTSSNFSILTSGTATLEYALNGVPSVAIYKTNFLSALLGKKLINMNNIILPNWILGSKYMEFLFQENCNPQNIAKELINLINDKNKINRSNINAKKLRKLLTANKKTFNQNVNNVIQHHLNL